MKAEPAAFDRKITVELTPKHDEKDGEEVKRDEQFLRANRADAPSQSIDPKESMVAEPLSVSYHQRALFGSHFISSCVTSSGGLRITGAKR